MLKLLTFAVAFAISSPVLAAVKVGNPAPAFTLKSASGEEVSLSDFSGKIVVLEWTNPDCPYVKKFYKNGDMQAFQSEATSDEVVWLAINSSAEGRQGHQTVESAAELVNKHGIKATGYLLDHDGQVGKAYGATNTPHMFILNEEHFVSYQGAIDSIPSADSADVEQAENYVMKAVAELKEGGTVTMPVTKPYGCSVKYAN